MLLSCQKAVAFHLPPPDPCSSGGHDFRWMRWRAARRTWTCSSGFGASRLLVGICCVWVASDTQWSKVQLETRHLWHPSVLWCYELLRTCWQIIRTWWQRVSHSSQTDVRHLIISQVTSLTSWQPRPSVAMVTVRQVNESRIYHFTPSSCPLMVNPTALLNIYKLKTNEVTQEGVKNKRHKKVKTWRTKRIKESRWSNLQTNNQERDKQSPASDVGSVWRSVWRFTPLTDGDVRRWCHHTSCSVFITCFPSAYK